MSKMLMVNINDIEESMVEHAEDIFNTVLKLTEQHGVCFMRFTRADGMVIIDPEYNQRINGVISDA